MIRSCSEKYLSDKMNPNKKIPFHSNGRGFKTITETSSAIEGGDFVFFLKSTDSGDIRLESRPRVVPFDPKVLVFEIIDIFHLRIYDHLRKRFRFSGNLFSRLFEMVAIEMDIPECMNKLSRFESGYLCEHHGKQCVTCDIERDSEKKIGRSLVEMEREFIIHDTELKNRMAGRYCHSCISTGCHRVDEFWIPSRYDNRFPERVRLEFVDGPSELVDNPSVARLPTSPLDSVDVSEISPFECELGAFFDFRDKFILREIPNLTFHHCRLIVLVWPLVPDVHVVIDEIFDIGVSTNEPEEFMDYCTQEYLLGRKKWKSLSEIISRLSPKKRSDKRWCFTLFFVLLQNFWSQEYFFLISLFKYLFHKIEVLILRMFRSVHK